jgi:hypothetical protein
MNNIAGMTKDKQFQIQQHKQECLTRYYQSMDKFRALTLKGQLEPRGMPTAKSKLFVERINYAKDYKFIQTP